ncbi:MAG: hypothetical protein Q9222_000828 [Ikaeria aurantiellina]
MVLPNQVPGLLLSLLSLSLCSALSVSPGLAINTPFNASSIQDDFLNTTLLGAIDPNAFDIDSRYGAAQLRPTSLLMTAVDTMVEVALGGWEGRMAPTTFVIDDPRYSHVDIVIRGSNSDGRIQNAYAVLGMFLVMNAKLSSPLRNFRASWHRLYYREQLVGTIEMKPHASLPVVNGPTTAKLSGPAWQDPRLEVSIARGLDTFVIYEVFYAVFALIRQVALYAAIEPRNTPLRDFTITIGAPPITTQPLAASFRNVGNPPRTARNPPFFQHRWLIKALGQLPQKMLASGNFKDIVSIGITVDNVRVGEGYLVRKQ